MKIKPLIVAFSIAIPLISNVSFAESPNWSSISVGYQALKIDDSEEYKPSGFSVSGVKLLNDNVFIGGGYSVVSDDIQACYNYCVDVDTEINTLTLGIGYRHPINATTDIYGTLSFVKVGLEMSLVGESESVDDNGHGLSIGLRSMLTDTIEAKASIDRSTIDGESENSFSLGGSVYLNEKVSIGGGVSFGDDVTGYSLALTYDF